MSCAIALRPSWTSLVRATRAAVSRADTRPHASSGHVDVAGPSRCFRSTSRCGKAVDSSLDHPPADVPQQLQPSQWLSSNWPASTPAQRISSPCHGSPLCSEASSVHREPCPTQPDPPPIPLDPLPSTHQDEQCTTAVSLNKPSGPKDKSQKWRSLYINTLSPTLQHAFLSSVEVLVKSGQRSLPTLLKDACSNTLGDDLSDDQRQQLACLILNDCLTRRRAPAIIWDLYTSWLPASEVVHCAPPGSTTVSTRRLQANTIVNCCVHMHRERHQRYAAAMLRDVRLNFAQAPSLVKLLANDPALTAPILLDPNSSSGTKARFAVHELAQSICSLLVRGPEKSSRSGHKKPSKQPSIHSEDITTVLDLLVRTESPFHVASLFKTAQRRAQLDQMRHSLSDETNSDHLGFWETREDEPAPPEIVETAKIEEFIRVMCSQRLGDAHAAYEVVASLPMSRRTATMYVLLMQWYGHALLMAPQAIDEQQPERTFPCAISDQLLEDLMLVPHLGGVTVEIISFRMVSHARTRQWPAVRADLAYVLEKLGLKHLDLLPVAKRAILRCGIETGYLRYTFWLAGHFISESLQAGVSPIPEGVKRKLVEPSEVVETLLLSAQNMRISQPVSPLKNQPKLYVNGGASRSRLLTIFLRYYSTLNKVYPQLVPTWETLTLYVRLLAAHERSLDARDLRRLMTIICRCFPPYDQRIVPLLLAFARIFETRGDSEEYERAKALIAAITSYPQPHTPEPQHKPPSE